MNECIDAMDTRMDPVDKRVDTIGSCSESTRLIGPSACSTCAHLRLHKWIIGGLAVRAFLFTFYLLFISMHDEHVIGFLQDNDAMAEQVRARMRMR